MAIPSHTPEIRGQTYTNAGQTMTFVNGIMGTVIIFNLGPNTVFLAPGGAVPAASFGDGRWQLRAGDSLNLGIGEYSAISGRCAVAETANVQITGFPKEVDAGSYGG